MEGGHNPLLYIDGIGLSGIDSFAFRSPGKFRFQLDGLKKQAERRKLQVSPLAGGDWVGMTRF